MRGIHKAFGTVRALQDVSIEVQQGTIHAIVGENGAGKTTLMKILYGAYRADQGEIHLAGEPTRLRSSAEAIAQGIGMVSQHYSVIPEMTCLQNLMLGAEPGVLVDRRASAERAETLARKMGFSFEWNAETRELSPAGAQKLEILKLLWREADVMILDEPTAMLSPADGEALFASLTQLASEGRTILLVTHRLPEVMQYCHAVDVLRGGRKVASSAVADTDARQLSEWIVGHEVHAPVVSDFEPGPSVLQIENLLVRGARGDLAVKDVDLTIRQGEVVGLAGVDGNGQRELFHAIVGVGKVVSGKITLCGEIIDGFDPSKRIERGLRLIPEDRHEEGVVEAWSLEANAALGLQRLPDLRRGPFVDRPARQALAERVAERFRTKHAGLSTPIESLSGGNQQRFVAARALEFEPRLILAFQPTRGLDIDGTDAVYDAIREACRAGAAALVVSFDLDELCEHCDRIVAINGGRLFEPGPSEAKSRAAIGRLMVGADA